jgi:hypothetical protein
VSRSDTPPGLAPAPVRRQCALQHGARPEVRYYVIEVPRFNDDDELEE